MNAHVANIDEKKAMLIRSKSGNKDITKEKLELELKPNPMLQLKKKTRVLSQKRESTVQQE